MMKQGYKKMRLGSLLVGLLVVGGLSGCGIDRYLRDVTFKSSIKGATITVQQVHGKRGAEFNAVFPYITRTYLRDPRFVHEYVAGTTTEPVNLRLKSEGELYHIHITKEGYEPVTYTVHTEMRNIAPFIPVCLIRLRKALLIDPTGYVEKLYRNGGTEVDVELKRVRAPAPKLRRRSATPMRRTTPTRPSPAPQLKPRDTETPPQTDEDEGAEQGIRTRTRAPF